MAALAAGVKPLVGVDIWLHNEADHNLPTRLVLLCQDRSGYLNLTRLISRSYIEGQERGVPMLRKEWLQGASAGLIALSGKFGDVGQALLAGNRAAAEAALADWVALFPERFYFELQRTGRLQDEEYLHEAVALAAAEGVPVVATNDVQFLKPEDFDAHEARVCIHDGRTLDDPRLVGVEVFGLEKMNVVGGRHCHALGTGEAHRLVQILLDVRPAGTQQYKVTTVTAQLAPVGERRLGGGASARQQRLAHVAGLTGQRDQPGARAVQPVLAHRRHTAFLAFDVAPRDEAGEIEIALAILAQQQQSGRLMMIGLVVHPQVDADQGFDARRQRRLVELHHGEQIALVGHRHRRHARGGAGRHQRFHAHDAVDQRIFGVDSQMNEGWRHGGYSSPATPPPRRLDKACRNRSLHYLKNRRHDRQPVVRDWRRRSTPQSTALADTTSAKFWFTGRREPGKFVGARWRSSASRALPRLAHLRYASA